MKKIVSMVFALGLSLSLHMGASAEVVPSTYPIRVQVNLKDVVFQDVKPFVDSATQRTMVPLRSMSDALGIKVEWIDETKTAVLTGEGKRIELKAGEKQATVNGQTVTFDTGAVIHQNRVYVPLRFVSEAFNANVNWVRNYRLIVVSTFNTKQHSGLTTGKDVPVKESNAFFQSLHKSLKIKDGVLTGTVPKATSNGLFINMEVRFKNKTSAVKGNGQSFSFQVFDVDQISFAVINRKGGKVLTEYGYYNLPTLVPTKISP